MNKYQSYSPVILRIGIAFVFLWFGMSQILNSSEWTSLIPTGIVSVTGISASTFVIMNGTFEIIAGILLAFGIGVRIVALLLSLHLLSIIADVGLTSIGIRDIGLLFATLAISFHGNDICSWSSDRSTI